jgi:DnaJ like chaperone protein
MRRYIGRILGVIFGALFAGALGAFFGFLIGLQVDRRHNFAWYGMQTNSTANAQAQQVFFETTFSMMGHIAKADGRVSEQEIRVAEQIMSHMQLNADRRRQAMALFNQGKDPAFDMHQAVHRLKQFCHHAPNLLRLFFEIQVRAASADGTASPAQTRLLQILAAELGINWIDFSQFEQIFRHFQQSHSAGGHTQQHNNTIAAHTRINPHYPIATPSSASRLPIAMMKSNALTAN